MKGCKNKYFLIYSKIIIEKKFRFYNNNEKQVYLGIN